MRLGTLSKGLALNGLVWARSVIPRRIVAKLLCAGGLRLEPNEAPTDIFNGARAALIISLDFEYPEQNSRMAFQLEEATSAVIRIAECFRIPITWAICGNAGLNELSLLNRIARSQTRHEIAVHTFNHTYVGASDCQPEVLRDEVTKSIDVFRRAGGLGLKYPRTFVFPGNLVGNLETVRELGFMAYRASGCELGNPKNSNGLWEFVPTYFLSERTSYRVLKDFLDLALSYRCVLHLWSHPWNMILDGSAELFAQDVLGPFLRYADAKRRDGLLWTCTMGEMAEYCEARQMRAASMSTRGYSQD